MNRYLTTFATFVFFALFALVPVSHAQQAASSSAVLEGVISVKFQNPAVAQVETVINTRGIVVQSSAQGIPVTGLASVDHLNRQFGVVHMERIFRPAGKFEDRHRKFGLHRWYQLRFDETTRVQAVVQAYKNNPNVELASPRYEVKFVDGYEPGKTKAHRVEAPTNTSLSKKQGASAITNDPFYVQQWHYHNTGQVPPGGTPDADIDLPEAHNLEAGNPDVIVSVHDGGIDVDHEDLAANMWVNEDEVAGNGVDDDNNGYVDDVHGYNFADDQGTIIADDHGTHVGGTIAAATNNNTGVAGVAGGDGSPDSGVRLMSAQVFGNAVGGFPESYTYAADNGAVISQNSWGYTSAGSFDPAVLTAIDYYIANAGSDPGSPVQGGLVIFAAGNDNDDGEWYPGFYSATVAVASTGIDDQKSGFSNFGPWVDISAPGGNGLPFDENDVFSTTIASYGYLAGTSMACPHASGVAALIASAAPGMTNTEVRDALESTTDDISDSNPGFDGDLGSGRINAFNALNSLDPDDVSPPGAIADLLAVLAEGGNNVELTWTAPADDAGDPASGPVAAYQIAYSDVGPIEDSTDFANATLVPGAPAPSDPGTGEGAFVTDLDFGVQYWFAVRATDDNANSTLSNSPGATTSPAPELAFSPDTLSTEMEMNEETTLPLTLTNNGPAGSELHFTFPAFAADALLASVPESGHNDVSRPIPNAHYTATGDDGSHVDPYTGMGNPVVLGAGGPDTFGYSWIDSDEPGGPSFNWVDISGVGTEVSFPSLGSTVTVDLPFTFEFYGEAKTEVAIADYGYLTFTNTDNADLSNDPIPDAQDPNNFIAAFWDAINPGRTGGAVYYHSDGGRFIVQYDNITGFSGIGNYTFQIILNDDGSILLQYLDMESDGDLESATLGIENSDGTDGLQVAFNTQYIHDGLAVALASEPDFVSGVDPVSGTIASGSNALVDVTFNTIEVEEPGLYEDELAVETNDPVNAVTSIPARVDAGVGPPDVAVRPSSLDFGQALVGQTLHQSFYIVNEGAAPLEVTSLSVDNTVFDSNVSPPTPLPFTVPIADSAEIEVAFTPDQVAVESGTVTVETNDPDTPASSVSVTGEGIPAPVAVTTPDSLSHLLEVNRSATDILMLENTGGSDLNFETSFAIGAGSGLTRDMVAAPAPSGAGSAGPNASGMTGSAQTPGSSPGNPGPLDAMDDIYQLDDGTSENGLGLGNLGDIFDMMWLHAFEVVENAGAVTSISTAWGCSTCGASNLPVGKQGLALVYEDPNDDGDPNDAVLLTQEPISIADPGTNNFTTVATEATAVEGTFFIAVLLEDMDPSTFPAPMDESSDYQGAAWFVGAGTGEDFNISDLSANSVAPTELGGAGFPANWLLRADGGASFVSVTPASGTVAAGASIDLSVNYSSDGLDPAIYSGDVLVTSNDPANPVDLTPTTLEVIYGDPIIALDSSSVDFGDVFANGSTSNSVKIYNQGNAPLEITDMSVDNAAFSVDFDGSFTVDLGDSASVGVSFSPDAVQSYSGTLTIESNDPESGSITAALTGEGIPAPVIAWNPETLFEALEIGQTASDTLTITNDGGSDLDFSVGFNETGGSSVDRSVVAAPTSPSDVSGSAQQGENVIAAATPSGDVPSTPVPLDAPDAEYQVDDGTSENGLGIPAGGFDIMWMNAFEAIGGSANIATVYSTYGWSGATGLPDNRDATAYVYDDLNDDGNPADAVKVAEVDFQLQNPHTDEFTSVDMGGASVDGVFFVAVLFADQQANQFPIPLDENSGSMQSSWIADATAGTFDDENLSNNRTLSLIDDLGFPANIMVRADGGGSGGGGFPEWLAVVPFEGTLAPGESQNLTVNYDASAQTVGLYEGDIQVATNDPVTPVAAVPTTMDVTTAPYPFALAPDAIDVTLDLTQGDSMLTEGFSIANVTDDEQFFLIETRSAEGEGPNMVLPTEVGRLLDEAANSIAAKRTVGRGNPLAADPETGKSGTNPIGKLMQEVMGPQPLAEVGVTAYGNSVGFASPFQDNLVQFDLGEPSNLSAVGALPNGYAGDFPVGEEEFFYMINTDNQLLQVEVATGVTTTIGMAEPTPSGDTWTEMKTDPTDGTMYATTGTDIYTVDPETAEVTHIAEISGLQSDESVIAMAIDTDGQMYAHVINGFDSAPDDIYLLDKETGVATHLGSTGVDALFAQGMDFDPITGELYMAWYEGGGVGGLRVVDRQTGNSTLVGPFQGDEISFLAIPSEGFLFLATDLLSGTLAPGGEISLDANIDARGFYAGTYEAELAVISNEPGMPEDFIPVTLTVVDDPQAEVQPVALNFGELFVGGETTLDVTVMNTGGADLNVSDIQVSPEVFTISDGAETSFTLEPTDSRTFTVTFAPDAVQDFSGSFTVVSDDPDGDVSASLSGEGIPAPVLAVSPESFNVRAVPGETFEKTLDVSNTGGNPLTYEITGEFVSYEGTEQDVIFEDILIEEDFNDGIPSDWTVSDTYPGGVTWGMNSATGRDNWTGGDGSAATADSDANGSGAYDTKLISPTVTATVENFVLEYKANYANFAGGDSLQVDISIDGGATWSNMLTWNEDHGDLFGPDGEDVSINLAPHIDVGDQFQVRWRYRHNDPDAFDWYVQIDDVKIYRNLEFLTISPAADSVAAGETQPVTLGFDTEGLGGGTYEVNLNITSNDPVQDVTTVPVTLEVIESLTVTPEPGPDSTRHVYSGTEFMMPITTQSLEQLGVESYEFTLNYADSVLTATGIETDGTLSQGLVLAVNTETDGEIHVAAGDTTGPSQSSPTLFTIEGEGTLLYLTFEADEDMGTSEVSFSNFLFNEGNPGVTTETTTYDVGPLLGDASLNGMVGAFDADRVLQYMVHAIDMPPAGEVAGEVSGDGEMHAFDATLIFRYALGEIDCFPVEEGCETGSALAAMRTGENGTATLGWGTPEATDSQGGSSAGSSTTMAQSSAAGSGQLVSLPLLLEGDTPVLSFEIETQLDQSKVSLEAIQDRLPESWQMAYHVDDEGTLRIAAAGSEPLTFAKAESGEISAIGGEALTLNLHWKAERKESNLTAPTLALSGTAMFNEADVQQLKRVEVRAIPETFSLAGNYPNPFNGQTKIVVDLPKPADVTIKLYDVLGREVTTIERKEMPAGAGREITLDGRGLSSGVYFYRVTAEVGGAGSGADETHAATGRMTLVR